MTPAEPEQQARFPIPLQLASGRTVDLANVQPSDIHWPDLIEALIKIPRFNGATRFVTYTAAQHCCLMYDRAPDELKAYALLSDFHLALLGELTSPALSYMARLSGHPGEFRESYRLARDEITEAIWRTAGLDVPNEPAAWRTLTHRLRAIDKALQGSEIRDLMSQKFDFPETVKPYPVPVKPWASDKAETELKLRLSFIGIFPRG